MSKTQASREVRFRWSRDEVSRLEELILQWRRNPTGSLADFLASHIERFPGRTVENIQRKANKLIVLSPLLRETPEEELKNTLEALKEVRREISALQEALREKREAERMLLEKADRAWDAVRRELSPAN